MPVAQLGRQLFTVSVPLPSAVLPLHSDRRDARHRDGTGAPDVNGSVVALPRFGPGRQDITEGSLGRRSHGCQRSRGSANVMAPMPPRLW